MIDAESFYRQLDLYGEDEVRMMLAGNRFGEEKQPLVQEWLRRQAEAPVAVRSHRISHPGSTYQATKGDLEYRNAVMTNDRPNPFDEAVLLTRVSDAYLSVLAHDNSGERSRGFKAMIDAEATRRGSAIARRAYKISRWSLAIAAAALLVSLWGAKVAAGFSAWPCPHAVCATQRAS